MADQWASHPSTEERIERLDKLNIAKDQNGQAPAFTVFPDPPASQKKLTEKLFSQVSYTGPTTVLPFGEFKELFERNHQIGQFGELYRGYYDHKNPIKFDVDWQPEERPQLSPDTLFGQDKVDAVYELLALQNDIATVTSIGTGIIGVKPFDYDGKKYRKSQAFDLVKELKREQEAIDQSIAENDVMIFRYFRSMEKKPGKLASYYKELFEFEESGNKSYEIYERLIKATEFLQVTTPFDDIRNNFLKIELIEKELKPLIEAMLKSDLYKEEITPVMRDNFEKYLSKKLEYFAHDSYIDANLHVLFTAGNDFYFLLSRGYMLKKKRLLAYQASLLEK